MFISLIVSEPMNTNRPCAPISIIIIIVVFTLFYCIVDNVIESGEGEMNA